MGEAGTVLDGEAEADADLEAASPENDFQRPERDHYEPIYESVMRDETSVAVVVIVLVVLVILALLLFPA